MEHASNAAPVGKWDVLQQLPSLPGTAERLRPPSKLDAPERKIFVDLVASSKAEHFRSSDTPLLAAYCRAIVLERRSAAALAAGRRQGAGEMGEGNQGHGRLVDAAALQPASAGAEQSDAACQAASRNAQLDGDTDA
jgi:hypothetical protein